MYRDIEFRGKRIDGTEPIVVYGSLYQNKDGKCFIRVETDSILDMYEVDPDSIGQYTGMKDKSGLKIFENDLVKLITKDCCRIFKVVFGEVTRNVQVLDGFESDGDNIVDIHGWVFKLIYASDFDYSKEDTIFLFPSINEYGITDVSKMSIIDTDYNG